MTSDAAQSPAKRRLSLILAGGIAGVAVGLAGVYGISLFLGNAPVDPACRPAIETARRIKKDARLTPAPAIILVTAYGREEIMMEAEAAGLPST